MANTINHIPPEPTAYAFEPEDYKALRLIMQRLFAPEALTPDQRRDLANHMYVLLGRAEAIP